MTEQTQEKLQWVKPVLVDLSRVRQTAGGSIGSYYECHWLYGSDQSNTSTAYAPTTSGPRDCAPVDL